MFAHIRVILKYVRSNIRLNVNTVIDVELCAHQCCCCWLSVWLCVVLAG